MVMRYMVILCDLQNDQCTGIGFRGQMHLSGVIICGESRDKDRFMYCGLLGRRPNVVSGSMIDALGNDFDLVVVTTNRAWGKQAI